MAAAYLLLCVVVIAQISHYGNFRVLRKLILIVLSIGKSNQVKMSCDIISYQDYLFKIALATRLCSSKQMIQSTIEKLKIKKKLA